MIPDSKLAIALLAKIKEQDDRSIEIMSSGNLTDFGAYKYSAGYRKALADCVILINETHEEVMKE